MAWNSGGGPWGAPPGGRPPGGRPGSPWGGRGRRQFPDPDQLLARLKAWLAQMFGGFSGRHGDFPPGRIAAIVVAILVVGWLVSGFYIVQPDQEGVVLRFGAFVRTTKPGLNYHLPWPIEAVDTPAVTRVNRIAIGYRPTPGQTLERPVPPSQDIPAESLMLTGDQNIVDINFAVFWRIRNAAKFLFDVRHPAATTKAVAESVMREVVGHSPIEPLLTSGRAAIETQVRKHMQEILDAYGAGVEVTEVQLLKVDPPPEVIDSFRDVQRAGTDADRAKNNAQGYSNKVIPGARGKAAEIVAAAEATKASDIARASGDAKRFLSVLAAYRKNEAITLERLYIETMQDVLGDAKTVVLGAGTDSRLLPLLSLPVGGSPGAAGPGAKSSARPTAPALTTQTGSASQTFANPATGASQ